MNPAVLDHAGQRAPDRFRLLMNFLEHEVLIAALFRRFRVPGDLGQRQLLFIPVQVIEGHLSGYDPGGQQVFHIIDLPGVFQQGRNIGGQIRVLLRDPDDQGGILPGGIDFPGIIAEHDRQGIASPNPDHHPGEGVHRSDFVFVVVIVDQLDHHFRIRVAVEPVAMAEKLFLQLRVVLNNPVVDADNLGFHRPGGGT